jgi:arabinose-5-phosphate isomerase
MHTRRDMPLVASGSQLTTALEEMSAKGLGMTGIVNPEGHLIGIYTDGDVRRSINQSIDVKTTVIDQVMVSDPRSTTADALAAEVVQLMRQHSINGLFAVDPEQRPIGALNALDLMRAGIF